MGDCGRRLQGTDDIGVRPQRLHGLGHTDHETIGRPKYVGLATHPKVVTVVRAIVILLLFLVGFSSLQHLRASAVR